MHAIGFSIPIGMVVNSQRQWRVQVPHSSVSWENHGSKNGNPQVFAPIGREKCMQHAAAMRAAPDIVCHHLFEMLQNSSYI